MFENVTQNYTGGDATLEIVIMLAVAFVLGFLLRHIFCKADDEAASATASRKGNETMARAVAPVADKPAGQGGEPAPPAGSSSSDDETTTSAGQGDESGVSVESPGQRDEPTGPAGSSRPVADAASSASDDDSGKPDDLRRIDGIGPKIAELLVAQGIDRFAKLAEAETERLKRILDEGGPRFRMHDPSSWPHQARLLAEGREDEFKAFVESRRAPGGA